MSSPYTSVAVTNFNTNPPSDDGSEVASNQLDWDFHVDKLATPLKNAIESINTNVQTAFQSIYGQNTAEVDADVTPSDYTILPFTGGRYGLSASASAADNAGNLLDLYDVAVQGKRNRIDLAAGVFTSNAVDVTAVPNYKGKVTLFGTGIPNKADSSYDNGTLIDFQNTSGASLILGNGTTTTRTIGLQNLCLKGKTSDEILDINYAPQQSEFRQLLIINTSTGGGIIVKDVWSSVFEDIWIVGPGSTGTGFAYNAVQGGGGNNRYVNVNCEDLALAFDFGAAYDGARTKFIKNHVLRQCQSSSCLSGYRLRAGVGSLRMEHCWAELLSGAGSRGVLISDMAGYQDGYLNPGHIEIIGMNFSWVETSLDLIGVEIGDNTSVDTTDGAGDVTIRDATFDQNTTGTIAVRIHNSVNSGDREITKSKFHNNGGQYIVLDDECQYGQVDVLSNQYDGLAPQNVIEDEAGNDMSHWCGKLDDIMPVISSAKDYSNAKRLPSQFFVNAITGSFAITLPSAPIEFESTMYIGDSHANDVTLDPGALNLNGTTTDLVLAGLYGGAKIGYDTSRGYVAALMPSPQTSAWTTGAHATLRDFTGTTTAAEALQLIETLADDLKNAGVLK